MSGSAKLYVVAGEPSGDLHGAGLLDELKRQIPGVEIRGAGGPLMSQASESGTRDWVDDAAVMGVWEVLKRYGWFKQEFARMLDEVRDFQPDVLLCIDYPGFNLRFAAAVRKCCPQVKLVHYICPQVWAWHKERIPKMAGLLDEVLCLFPFEPGLFSHTKLRATFVGHPMVDELAAELSEPIERTGHLVGLFPGSREREVTGLFPMMIETAKRLRSTRPDLEFEVPAATPSLGKLLQNLLRAAGADSWIRITEGGSHRLMRRAVCGVIASGTATLEAACLGLPYALVYRVAPLTYWLARRLVKIPHIGLVNILAGREVVTELIQHRANPADVAATLQPLLDSPSARNALQQQLAATAAMLGGTGAHERAAAAVAGWMNSRSLHTRQQLASSDVSASLAQKESAINRAFFF